MIKGKKILVVAAHHDDEVLGCAGTIYKLSEFNEINVLIVTESSTSQYPKLSSQYINHNSLGHDNKKINKDKNISSEEIRKLLRINEYFFADLPDMNLESIKSTLLNDIIHEHIVRTKANVVFTHHFGDVNKDHRLIFDATLVACRPINHSQYVEQLYCYEVLSSSEWSFTQKDSFNPNVWVDITDYISLKEKAMGIYKIELRPYPHPRSKKGIRIHAQKRGLEVGLKYAECFYLVRNTVF